MLYDNFRKVIPHLYKKFIFLLSHTNVGTYKCLSFDSKKASKLEMVRVLNVAEKNDAAKSIAELMSNGRYVRREGRSVYNKIYEFEFTVFNQRCTMIMTSVSGHLLQTEFIGNYRKWQACDPVALFEAPIVYNCLENFIGIKQTLESEVRGCTHLILWTDCDREGENIAFEIIDVCKKVKSSINIHRAKFSEITHHAVIRAVNNLVAPDQRTNDAVNVRKELDLRIGAAFTRFQTLRLQRVFPDVLASQLISYGSCQFPTLGFVVDRYKQVQAFIPEPFWKIKVLHKKEEMMTEFTWKRNRLFDHTACLVLYQLCLEEPTATVTEVKSRPKSKWRPLPLDTVELEKTASQKLRINAKEALNIAEKLYTKGFISYPRTETNIFPKELDLVNLVQMQANDCNWGAFANRVLQDGPNPRQGTKTDNAHPPIHPIKYTDSLQGNDKTIYDFVVRRFLACVSKDAQGHETTVDIDVNSEKFAVSGLMILAKNYLDVYPYEKWNAKEIGMYTMDETFQPSSIEMNEGETTAPNLLTEADLISLMEKHGIGTDATHSEHIETIKARLYVGVNENSRFVPGELGMGLVEGYDLMGFHMSKPNLRSELEADLKRICEGAKDPQVVLREQVAKYKMYFIEAVRQANKIDEALSNYFRVAPGEAPQASYQSNPVVLKCPRCSGDVVLKRKREGNGYFLSCMSFPQCTAVLWMPESVEDISVTDQVCQECRPSPVFKLNFKVKRGSFMPFYDDEFVGCIGGCDTNLMEVMNIRPLSSFSGQQNSSNVTSSRNSHNSDSGFGSRSSVNSGSDRRNTTNTSSVNSVSTRRNTSDTSSTNSASTRRNTTDTSSMNSASTRRNTTDTSSMNSASTRRNTTDNCANSASSHRNVSHNPTTSRNSWPFNSGNGFADSVNSSSSSSQSTSYSNQRSNNFNFGTPENKIVCSCSLPAIKLTVRKEGPNTGRQFYKCSNSNGPQCNFFLWADNDANITNNTNHEPPQALPPSVHRPITGQRSLSTNDAASDDIRCNCDYPAKLLTVNKEGVNKGRKFYSCCKPRGDDNCNFFKWADLDAVGPSSSSTVDAARGTFQRPSKRQIKSEGGAATKRRCGLCSQSGHNRKNCPLKK